MISLTIFESTFDNKTHRKVELLNWDAFVSLLYKLSLDKKQSKKDSALISPAVYESGTRRANKNVLYWGGWAAVDVDDYQIVGDLKDDLHSRFGDWNYICYSTASSTIDKPKFRLVFELDSYVQQSRIKQFWFALNTRLESIGDRQTKDLSRMYYVPAKYANANNFFFCNRGSSVNVNDLIEKYPYVEKKPTNNFLDKLPPELQEAVLNYRKEQLQNTNIVWSSYRDCPFFPRALATKYISLQTTGWYQTMYHIMVAIATNALKQKYPISVDQIVKLCREFDSETGKWYERRPMDKEAASALEYAYRNVPL